MLSLGAQNTALLAQGLQAPVHLYGLWNNLHPLELVIDSNLQGYLFFPDRRERIQIHGQDTGQGWLLHEVLPDGSLAGTWTLMHSDRGRRARWINYNESLGAFCSFDTRPQPIPDLQIRFFQFRTDSEGEWYFFIYPAPPDKWRGIAWSTTKPEGLDVTGIRAGDELDMRIYDDAGGRSYNLRMNMERRLPRFGFWKGQLLEDERIRFRHRKGLALEVIRVHDYYRDMLLLLPDIQWPAWKYIHKNHVDPARRAFRREGESWEEGRIELKPWQRQAIRLYAWVTWSFLRSDLLSGTLHISNSWDEPAVVPFLITDKSSRPLRLEDVWHPFPVPDHIQQKVSAASVDPAFLELRPDGLLIGRDERIHIPTSDIRGLLPKNSPLFPYFGK